MKKGVGWSEKVNLKNDTEKLQNQKWKGKLTQKSFKINKWEDKN